MAGTDEKTKKKKQGTYMFVGMPRPEGIGNRTWAEFLGWEKTKIKDKKERTKLFVNAPEIEDLQRKHAPVWRVA
jgi:hypothetical protein